MSAASRHLPPGQWRTPGWRPCAGAVFALLLAGAAPAAHASMVVGDWST